MEVRCLRRRPALRSADPSSPPPNCPPPVLHLRSPRRPSNGRRTTTPLTPNRGRGRPPIMPLLDPTVQSLDRPSRRFSDGPRRSGIALRGTGPRSNPSSLIDGPAGRLRTPWPIHRFMTYRRRGRIHRLRIRRRGGQRRERQPPRQQSPCDERSFRERPIAERPMSQRSPSRTTRRPTSP